MDRSQYRRQIISCGLFFALCIFLADITAAAEEKDKPGFELPDVLIIGRDTSRLEFIDKASLDYEKEDVLVSPEAETGKAATVLTSGFGRFETNFYDFMHSGRSQDLRYLGLFHFKRRHWDRANSEEITYAPRLNLTFLEDERTDLSLGIGYLDHRLELPGPRESPTPASAREIDSLSLSGIYDTMFLPHGDLSIEAHFDYAEIEDNLDRPDYENFLYGVKAAYNVERINLGLELARAKLEDNYDLVSGSLRLRNNFVSLDERSELSFGLRLEGEEGFGFRLNPECAVGLKLAEHTNARLKIERRLELSRFHELYLEPNFVEVNPRRLRPERVWDIRFEIDHWFRQNLQARLAIFRCDIKDVLIWDDADGNGLYSPVNVTRAYLEGIKIGGECYLTDTFSHYLDYTYNDIHNKDMSISRLPYYPEHHLETGLVFKGSGGLGIDLSGEYIGRRHYDKAREESLSGYFLVNAKISYDLSGNASLFLILDNLLNDSYEIRRDYPGLGRNVLAGVTLKF